MLQSAIDGIIDRWLSASGAAMQSGASPVAVPQFAPTEESYSPPKSKWTLPEEIENFIVAIETDSFVRKVNAVMMGVRDYKQCLEWKKSKTLEIRVNPHIVQGHIWYRFFDKAAKEDQSMMYCVFRDRRKFQSMEQCPDVERCGDPQCLIDEMHSE